MGLASHLSIAKDLEACEVLLYVKVLSLMVEVLAALEFCGWILDTSGSGLACEVLPYDICSIQE